MTAKKKQPKKEVTVTETAQGNRAVEENPRARALIEGVELNILNLALHLEKYGSPFAKLSEHREEILKASWPGKGLPPDEIRRFRRVRKTNPSEIVFGWRFEPGGEFFEDPYLPDRYGKFCLREGEYIEGATEGQTIWQVLHQRLEAAVLWSLLGAIPADGARTFVKLVEEISAIQSEIIETLNRLERNCHDYYYLYNQLAMARNLLEPQRERHTVAGHEIEIRPARSQAIVAAMEHRKTGPVAKVATTLSEYMPSYSVADGERDLASCMDLMSRLRSLAEKPIKRESWLELGSRLQSMKDKPINREGGKNRGGGRFLDIRRRLLIAEVAAIFDENAGWWLGLKSGRRLWQRNRDVQKPVTYDELRYEFINVVLKAFRGTSLATRLGTIVDYAPNDPAIVKKDLRHMRSSQ